MVFLIIKKSSSSAHFVAGCFSSASACFVCLSSFLFLEELALKLLKWKKVFVFRSLDITTENNNTHSTHTHTHTHTLRYKHHGTFCASFVWREWGTRQRQRGTAGKLGERGQACQLDFFMGEFSDLCALFLLFSLFVFLLFFSVFWCVLSLLSIPLLPAPQFCRCFVFPIQLKAESRKNFIMKLNRCQFIRLETRQYLELSAISLLPLSISLFLITRVLSKICRHLLCIFYDSFPLYLPPSFLQHFPQCLPASFAATNR